MGQGLEAAQAKPRRERGSGRVWRMGNIWWIQYYARGKQMRESSGSRHERDARKLLTTRLSEAHLGLSRDLRTLRYEDLRNSYMDYYETNKKKSLERRTIAETGEKVPHLSTVARLDPFFERYKVSHIDSDAMVRFIKNQQDKGLNDATIDKSLSALRRMFRLAKKAGKIRDLPNFPMLNVDNKRTGILARDKYVVLRDSLPEYARIVLIIGYNTGMRLGEIRCLRWEAVDFLNGVIRLEANETKTGEAREIPIASELGAALKEQYSKARRADSAWVCFRIDRRGQTLKLGDFRKVWQSACVKLGLGRREENGKYVGLIFHDLRRTFVTDAEHVGAPRHEVMRITGHKTESTYKRYAIGNMERRRAALRDIEAYRASVENGANSGQMDLQAPAQQTLHN